MAFFPDRMSDETFDQAWSWVAKKYRRSKRRFAVEVPVSWITNVVFFLCVVVLLLGVIMEQMPVVRPYIAVIPQIGDFWSRFTAWLAEMVSEPMQMQLLAVGLAFLVPALASASVALLIKLLYHPRTPAKPEGTGKEKALALQETAKSARNYTRKATHNIAVVFAFLFGMSAFLFLSYVLLAARAEGIELVEVSHANILLISLYIIAAFLVYWILTYLARLVAMPLYYCRVSEKHIEELEQYWRRLCDEEGTEPAPAPEAVQPVVFSRNSETSEDTDSYLC